MNTINKKTISRDPLAEVKKSKNFQKYSKEADDRIRLAVEVYNQREKLGLSQQKLAKLAGTTQKVISNIENGDYNPGLSLLQRIGESLNFDYKNWAKLHNEPTPDFSYPILGAKNTSNLTQSGSVNSFV